jgi:diacylglycerol kinase (ATP)
MRVILNPAARHGAGHRLRPVIERELGRRGLDIDIIETEGPGHAAELAGAAAAAGIGRVIAAGGDGTVHEVANGLMNAGVSGTALGLIPIGTGNDFVKMVPGTSSISTAFDTLRDGIERPVDVGVVRWEGRTEHFMNAMGTGIDVEVVRQMRRSSRMPGGMIYLTALARALVRFRPMPIRIVIDDEEINESIMILAVCNGPSIGGSFRVCPDARPDDGILDVCVVGQLPLHRIVRTVPRVLRGTHAGQPGITMRRGTTVRLARAGGEPFSFQLDGELRETETEILVTFAARPLNVICTAPAGAGRKD